MAVLFGKEGTDMTFVVYHADGSLCYEGGSWPMARAALDRVVLADEDCPQLVIRPEPKSEPIVNE